MFLKHSKIPSNLYTYEIVTNHQQKQKNNSNQQSSFFISVNFLLCWKESQYFLEKTGASRQIVNNLFIKYSRWRSEIYYYVANGDKYMLREEESQHEEKRDSRPQPLIFFCLGPGPELVKYRGFHPTSRLARRQLQHIEMNKIWYENI